MSRVTKLMVWNGTADKTTGGLTKKDLKMSKSGKVVSATKSAQAKKTQSPALVMWRKSVAKAYQMPKYKGTFQKLKCGSAFYKDVRKIYEKMIKKDGRYYTKKTNSKRKPGKCAGKLATVKKSKK